MSKLISHREKITEISYERFFEDRDRKGSGLSFPCDIEGNIYPLDNEAARSNLEECINDAYNVIDRGVREYNHSYWQPAKLQCNCGHILELEAFTNTCDRCGQDYNSSGQELAPREQWGEETGETPDEILAIGHHIS